MVDDAVSINSHIIVKNDFVPSDDYQSTFKILAQNGVLSPDFAQKIAPSVGLRNQVVHRYGDVNLSQMIDQIRSGIRDYVQYMEEITAYIVRPRT